MDVVGSNWAQNGASFLACWSSALVGGRGKATCSACKSMAFVQNVAVLDLQQSRPVVSEGFRKDMSLGLGNSCSHHTPGTASCESCLIVWAVAACWFPRNDPSATHLHTCDISSTVAPS
jgi:hypothetical protein